MTTLLQVPFFEGCEKKIEIHFDAKDGDEAGMRQAGRQVWAAALAKAGITIESETKAPEWDCYMLSESSLFVSRDRIVCKTCGQSAPLAILADALSHGDALGCPALLVLFSRSNLLKPELQKPMHRSFSAERAFLDGKLQVPSNAYTFGDVHDAHWNLYVAQLRPFPTACHHRCMPTLEVAMYDLDPTAMARWMSGMDAAAVAKEQVVAISSALCPSPIVDDMVFDPCGYSMNAYGLGGTYCCVHVTPQDGCSFASFEASAEDPAQVAAVVQCLVELFRPAKVSTVLLELGDTISTPSFRFLDTAALGYAQQAACAQLFHTPRVGMLAAGVEGGGRFRFSSFVDEARLLGISRGAGELQGWAAIEGMGEQSSDSIRAYSNGNVQMVSAGATITTSATRSRL